MRSFNAASFVAILLPPQHSRYLYRNAETFQEFLLRILIGVLKPINNSEEICHDIISSVTIKLITKFSHVQIQQGERLKQRFE